jgi:hypothetical protein
MGLIRSSFLFFSLLLGLQVSSVALSADGTMMGERKIFTELLQLHQKFPEMKKALGGVEQFPEADPSFLDQVSPSQIESRYRLFNRDYRNNLALEKTIFDQLRLVKSRLDKTPISNLGTRSDLELKYKALQDRHAQVRRILFLLSWQANESLREAMKTLSPLEKQIKAAAVQATQETLKKPKMPGVFGGSRGDRLKMSEADKINLTPIDDQFYATQLGQKLEADLGGRAQFWSYDFQTDELFVVVNDSVSKLRVKEDRPGVRFIQTRVGPRFEEPRGSDTQVDLPKAQGRFLTGESGQETLFGKMPTAKDAPGKTQGPNSSGGGDSTPSSEDH